MAIPVTTKRKTKKGKHIAIYAGGKFGKTTFLMHAAQDIGPEKSLIMLCGEDGMSEDRLSDGLPVWSDDKGDYRVFGQSGDLKEWSEFLESLYQVYNEWAGPGKYLLLDSVDLLINGSCEEYCVQKYFEEKEKRDHKTGQYVTKTKREQAYEFGGNQLVKCQSHELERFFKYINLIQDKGTSIITTWHHKIFKYKSPHDDMDYDKIGVNLPGTKEVNLREMLKNQVSALLYGDLEVNKNRESNRMDGSRVYLYTKTTPRFDATQMRGVSLPDSFPFDYKSFKKLISKAN